jgi:hypothetical protein
MAKLFYLHWNETEAKERARQLRSAGHVVQVHWSTTQPPRLKDKLPEIAVISLTRLPSHGRAVAEWLWEAKSRRHIPLIFEGGATEKVAAIRSKFRNAHFCTAGRVGSLIKRLQGRRATNAEA